MAHANPPIDKGLREDGKPRVRAASATLPNDHPRIEQRVAAALLGINLQTLVKRCDNGEFERIKDGGRYYLWRAVVMHRVQREREAGQEAKAEVVRKELEVKEKWQAEEQARLQKLARREQGGR